MMSIVRSARVPRLGPLQQLNPLSIHAVNSLNSPASIKLPSYSCAQKQTTSLFRPALIQPRFQFSSSRMPTALKVGDTIPSGHFKYIPFSPELSSPTVCGNPTDLKTDSWKGKKIVLFGVPGAFTKTCSNNHLPGFIEKAAEIKSKGVAGIYCIASNDAFVMSGWGRLFGSNEHVEMISDTNLHWLEPAGLTVDLSGHGLGKRGTRFALIIDDLKVTYVGIEESPGSVSGSGVDAVLAKL